uniref:Double jelly roll-like domain-containing protein n=1 Tax=Glossina morsitans morsitans TaxID=37546 RepID=A0A1B0GD75_GLOMM
MSNIINILQKPQFDNSIIKKEYHSYTSYLQSFKNNDEIQIDRTRHLGITTEIKNFTSLNKRESESLLNAGWSPFNNEELTIVSAYFNFCIPLKMLLGFAEDFNKIIVNSKHELFLLRSKDKKKAITTTLANEQIKLSILNITWKMPHVQLADAYKLEMFKKINSRQ